MQTLYAVERLRVEVNSCAGEATRDSKIGGSALVSPRGYPSATFFARVNPGLAVLVG